MKVVAWWWVMVGYVVGQIVAVCAVAICMGREPDEPESKYFKR